MIDRETNDILIYITKQNDVLLHETKAIGTMIMIILIIFGIWFAFQVLTICLAFFKLKV